MVLVFFVVWGWKLVFLWLLCQVKGAFKSFMPQIFGIFDPQNERLTPFPFKSYAVFELPSITYYSDKNTWLSLDSIVPPFISLSYQTECLNFKQSIFYKPLDTLQFSRLIKSKVLFIPLHQKTLTQTKNYGKQIWKSLSLKGFSRQ